MEAIPSGETSMPFGRYLIRERMAQGGMGEVFLAVAVGADGFEKSVVIKRLLPKFAGRADIVSLLAREAKLMTRLLHPNIVQVIDFGRGQSNDYFLVMELVSGTDLGRFCRAQTARHGRVSPPLALFITGQMLRGLAYAHATASADGQRLVHRDISPGNVLLSTFGEVKIADFGVALVASSADPGDHDGWLVGKPDYMAPEQLTRGGVDERADIYSVGAVLFQTLTGTSHRDPKRTALETVVSEELAQVVSRALAERPEDRYASAREMGRAIDQLVEHGQKLATADDLAEAVAAAAPIEPQRSKPVLMLSASEPDSLASGTELRRSGDAGAGDGFTLKIGGDSVRPLLPEGAPRSPEPAPRSRRWLWTLGVAALSLIGVTVGLGARGDHRDPVASPPPQGSSPPGTAEQTLVMPPSVEAPVISGDPPPRRPDPSNGSHAGQRAKEPVKEPAPPPAAAQEGAPTCRGQVHLYANHGWLVAGGPATVQAPGRYEWPCGTYALRASSRTDDHDSRSISVTVRETAPGVVDLR
jgi:serine/threonine-protein kinase